MEPKQTIQPVPERCNGRKQGEGGDARIRKGINGKKGGVKERQETNRPLLGNATAFRVPCGARLATLGGIIVILRYRGVNQERGGWKISGTALRGFVTGGVGTVILRPWSNKRGGGEKNKN